ncbi:bifunctional copper resistance protein CopD/cytochrome c oxidase assembly protein [Arthrobacter sp. zg-Y20]|uniref:cytochrome c oxidase assembly protein n=1 Tax=unclassified Arthrobacter TaxID=235627 RepID=UPI001D155481|nr:MULTISPECIES: cytochrome c oxidase assembly protein [unclassified Arthrobacter]MCC3275172.1 bifunctional copper resistance protein CopD/cytochrome c oxidase assembly protein [Arthrobacter sp. zg-Y20]MDK1315329.1 cytochrome c oxidase assembly protein [Arthrobacter sp. zg.Y20]WIB07887.1 cytochrome c oxidase assembly protein [Arthrobacter sp. zg-Y20]
MRTGWLAAAGALVFIALASALLFTGAAGASQLGDPGALTRWALPAAKAVQNISMAAVIGSLLFAVAIVPKHLNFKRTRKSDTGRAASAEPEHPAFTRTLTLASGAAILWTVSALAVMVFTYSDVSGLPLSAGSGYTDGLASFLTDFSTGRAWLAISIIAAVVTALTFGVRSLGMLAFTLILAVGALLPTALIGHSAGGDDHSAAVNSIGLHLLGVCLWIGGIIVLAVVSRQLGSITGVVLTRFSGLAGFAFALVFLSGVVNASLRITSLDQLGSRWGALVLTKAALTLLLGLLGLMHRRWIIPRLAGSNPARTPGTAGATAVAGSKGDLSAQRVLWQLVAVELAIMGAVSGVAVALGRTAPPRSEELPTDASPARILTGYDLPPELTSERYLTEWRPDWLWVAIIITLAVTYLISAVKLRRRGDKWPVLRTACWLIGLMALAYITSGAPAVYGMVLFSTHMLGHMALTMVVPLFLVLGAPVTLALKTLAPRRDGTRGIREWILIGVHSRYSKIITNPIFAAVNFAGSIVIFYYSDLFGFALREHVGHELMVMHFLLTGYIFILTMIGIDPLPARAPYPLRLVILLATMAFHAFFGVAVMGGTALIQASYFGNMAREWGLSALADQQLGGSLMWGIGEIPTLFVAIGVAYQWSKSDARETRRSDRAAERNNDADLTAYNNMFATLAQHDARTQDQGDR